MVGDKVLARPRMPYSGATGTSYHRGPEPRCCSQSHFISASDRAAEEVGLKQGDCGDQPGACCSPPGPVWRCLPQAVDGGS